MFRRSSINCVYNLRKFKGKNKREKTTQTAYRDGFQQRNIYMLDWFGINSFRRVLEGDVATPRDAHH